MDGIYRIESMLCDELSDMGSKGQMNNTALDKIDTMAHALKNVQKIIAYYEGMSKDDGYSGEYSGRYMGEDRSYDDGRSYRYGDRSYENSYARRRDRMGRFTSRASSPDEMRMQLRQMAADAPSSKVKKSIEELIEELDR